MKIEERIYKIKPKNKKSRQKEDEIIESVFTRLTYR